MNSGTSALIAGLTAIKINSGDKNIQNKPKVVTSPLTYVATANAIVLAGMEPVFVDVDPDTFTIPPENVKAVLEKDRSEKVGGVLPVHLMGYVCDMARFEAMAKKRGLQLFEDSSQAHGSLYKGRRAGSWSHASSFSFYIAHNIQAGELGAVSPIDTEVARRIRKIKANGRACDCAVCTRPEGKCPKFREGKGDWDPRFLHDEIGYNFKTTEFSTAIANAQVSRANEIAEKRRANVKAMNDLLVKHSSILKLPLYSDDVSYLGYPLVIRDPKRLNRERLQIALEREGVETRPLFGCVPLHQPAYAHLKKKYRGSCRTLSTSARTGSTSAATSTSPRRTWSMSRRRSTGAQASREDVRPMTIIAPVPGKRLNMNPAILNTGASRRRWSRDMTTNDNYLGYMNIDRGNTSASGSPSVTVRLFHTTPASRRHTRRRRASAVPRGPF